MSTINDDLKVIGNIHCTGTIGPARPRTEHASETDTVFPIPLTRFRVWDALQTNLPGTAASDDLAISGGTWATHAPKLTAGDLKAAGATTRRARCTVSLPPEYVAAGAIKIRISSGMETTVADTSCTVDVEAFLVGRDGTIDGSDLVATAAQSMNSLTFADKDFTVTATTLTPGDDIDIRVSITCTDAATVTAVTPSLGAIEIVCTIRG